MVLRLNRGRPGVRDLRRDLLVLTDGQSLNHPRAEMALPIAVPELSARELNRGHAVHFRRSRGRFRCDRGSA